MNAQAPSASAEATSHALSATAPEAVPTAVEASSSHAVPAGSRHPEAPAAAWPSSEPLPSSSGHPALLPSSAAAPSSEPWPNSSCHLRAEFEASSYPPQGHWSDHPRVGAAALPKQGTPSAGGPAVAQTLTSTAAAAPVAALLHTTLHFPFFPWSPRDMQNSMPQNLCLNSGTVALRVSSAQPLSMAVAPAVAQSHSQLGSLSPL